MENETPNMTPEQRHKFECTLYCPTCGSDEILTKAWINANNYEYQEDCDDDDYWCNDCEMHIRKPKTLKQLWNIFTETPVNNGRIQDGFMFFAPMTPIYEVLNWFSERCPNGINDLL